MNVSLLNEAMEFIFLNKLKKVNSEKKTLLPHFIKVQTGWAWIAFALLVLMLMQHCPLVEELTSERTLYHRSG